MNQNQTTRHRQALPFSCLLAVVALVAAACGGNGNGGSGSNGSGGSSSSGTGSSSGSSSENTCCINGTNYSCATAAEAESCFSNLDPGPCTETGSSSNGQCGSVSSSSGAPSSSSSGGSGQCGTNSLAADVGKECQDPSDCSTNFCDQNTPNALNSYCSQACSSIADCPCPSVAGTWKCDINPKYSAVQKYCINTDAGG